MHHGEFKTPGGKLVKVDLAVDGDRLADVAVTGDFFLYPEEALADIAGSLDGAAVGATGDELAARIAAAIPPGTEWLGSSPAGLATAVRRALDAGPVVSADPDEGTLRG